MTPPMPAAIHGRASPRDGGGGGGGGVWRGGSLLAAASEGPGSGSGRGVPWEEPVPLTGSGDGAAAVSGAGFVIGSLATSLAVPSIVGGGRRRRPPGGRPVPNSPPSSLMLFSCRACLRGPARPGNEARRLPHAEPARSNKANSSGLAAIRTSAAPACVSGAAIWGDKQKWVSAITRLRRPAASAHRRKASTLRRE